MPTHADEPLPRDLSDVEQEALAEDKRRRRRTAKLQAVALLAATTTGFTLITLAHLYQVKDAELARELAAAQRTLLSGGVRITVTPTPQGGGVTGPVTPPPSVSPTAHPVPTVTQYIPIASSAGSGLVTAVTTVAAVVAALGGAAGGWAAVITLRRRQTDPPTPPAAQPDKSAA